MSAAVAALEIAYRSARYTLLLPDRRLELAVGTPSADAAALLRSAGVRHGALITACNPRSRWLPESENEARHAALQADLERRKWPWLPAQSAACDGNWREPGCFLLGGRRRAILSLLRRYDQNAWLSIDPAGAVSLCWRPATDEGTLR